MHFNNPKKSLSGEIMKLSHGLGIEASMTLLLFQLQRGHLDPNTLQYRFNSSDLQSRKLKMPTDNLFTFLSTRNELWYNLVTNCHVFKIKFVEITVFLKQNSPLTSSFYAASALAKERAQTIYIQAVSTRVHS